MKDAMKEKSGDDAIPPGGELREIFQTVSGSPPPADHLVTRLQYVADLVGALGRAPAGPCLVWRESASVVRHARVGAELVVGRKPEAGLAFADDDLLSRRHFLIRAGGAACILDDLQSRNGTAVNTSEHRVREKVLRDGDLIYAGRHIFAFLNPADSGRG